MTNHQSKRFLKILIGVCALWFLAGIYGFRATPDQRQAFILINSVTLIDLSLFITLFWILFFRDMRMLTNKLLFATQLTFKLVCLGVLAIVLKRLENKTALASAAGVGIMAAGPLISALILKFSRRGKH